VASLQTATSERGFRAAVEVAEELGLRFERADVLRDRSNLLVRLWPAPVVARVATATGAMRSGTAWLAREVEVAGHLARVGAPVVAPSAELPPGPHERDGLALTFFEYVDELDAPLDAAEAGRGLRLCHEALADFDGELPPMATLAEAERVVDRLAGDGALARDDVELMRRVAAAVRASVERLGLPMQPVHGDAHLGNVLATARGPLWNDWEDTFLGPRAWDLGCLKASVRPFGRRDPLLAAVAREAYGDRFDEQTVDAFADARRFQVSVWGMLLSLARSDSAEVERYLAWWRDREVGSLGSHPAH
jgi:aminoglycoside phosphotransferase (APT) family kinase protein